MAYKLRPHQVEAVRKMHNGCVLWGGVGTGKTITSLAYALEREPGRKIIVITTAKVRNTNSWHKQAALMNIPIDDLTVDSWNNIRKYEEAKDAIFIFDEQRLVGRGAWVKSFFKIAKHNKWVLLSATPGDTWSDYGPMFVANGWYKNITEFLREHAVYSRYTTFPKIERWVNEGRLQKYRHHLLVEMPMDRHTRRHVHYHELAYDKELIDKVRKTRWNVFEDKPIENAAEFFSVLRRIVSTDPSRRQKLKDLISAHPRLIVFYNYNYELEILREICEEVAARTRALAEESTATSASEKDVTERSVCETPTDPSLLSRSQLRDFEDSLPPWELSEEEVRHLLSEWMMKNTSPEERTECLRTTTSTHSSPETTSSPSTRPSPTSTPARSDPQTSEASTPTRTPATATSTSPSRSPRTSSTRSSSAGSQPERTASREARTSETSSARLTDRRIPCPMSVRPTSATSSTAGETSSTPPTRTEPTSRPEPESTTTRSSSWTDSSTSGTSTSSHKYQKEHAESSPSSDPTGTTRTSSDSTSHPTTPTTPKSPNSEQSSNSSRTSDEVEGGSFGWAEYNGHKHQDIPDTDRWVYLVQYLSGAEGWNCVTTDAMAFWSLTYSWKQFEQGQGRIDRLNTEYEDLHYHVLITDSEAEKPVMKSLNNKKDFQPRAAGF